MTAPARYAYDFPRPALAVDCVVFGLSGDRLMVLLVERGEQPFAGRWALPGGFVHIDESLDEAARRELAEETGLTDIFLEQLYTFGEPGRDPRGPTVTVGYYALVDTRDHRAQAATDAREARWWPVDDAPPLAFDHERILRTALDRLKGKIRYKPIGFELLPRKFTLTQLQRLYETILGRPLDKRNFRKKVASLGLLVALDEHEQGVPRRRARLYRFDRRKYRELERRGFELQIG